MNMLTIKIMTSFLFFSPFGRYTLGPAKTYTLRGTPRTYAVEPAGCDRQLDNLKGPVRGNEGL